MTAERNAIGVEVNPVGWIYCKTKLAPAPKEAVAERSLEVATRSAEYKESANALPLFFQRCYASKVRRFLMAAQSLLDWRENDVDRTAMAFLLVNLHGKSTDFLSNQMRQTKAMSPQYAIEWWKTNRSEPPLIEPANFLIKRLEWRYKRGIPNSSKGMALLGDSTSALLGLRGKLGKCGFTRPSLMFTSPPYFGITNYHHDQWIRLWMLGGPPNDRRTPSPFRGKHQGKFDNLHEYRQLLSSVFFEASKLLRRDAVVYVRTDWREPTASITRLTLEEVFPGHKMRRIKRPLKGPTQTGLFGHAASRRGEIDFVLTP